MDSRHRPWTTRLWSPYRSSTYVSSLSVIEKPEDEKKEESKDIKKVPFGFGRVLEDS